MARIHGCHVTSRDAMLFMKYEHCGKCKGSFKDSQRKCKYWHMNATLGGANLHPGVNLLPGANLHPGANCAHEHGFTLACVTVFFDGRGFAEHQSGRSWSIQ